MVKAIYFDFLCYAPSLLSLSIYSFPHLTQILFFPSHFSLSSYTVPLFFYSHYIIFKISCLTLQFSLIPFPFTLKYSSFLPFFLPSSIPTFPSFSFFLSFYQSFFPPSSPSHPYSGITLERGVEDPEDGCDPFLIPGGAAGVLPHSLLGPSHLHWYRDSL